MATTETTQLLGAPINRPNQPQIGLYGLKTTQVLSLACISLAQMCERFAYYGAVVWFPTMLRIKSIFIRIQDGWDQNQEIYYRTNQMLLVSFAVLFLAAPLYGLLIDTFLKKSRALIIGSILALALYLIISSELLLLKDFHCSVNASSMNPSYVNSSTPDHPVGANCTYSYPPSSQLFKFCNSSETHYCLKETYILLIVLSLVSPFIRTALPAIGGDQLMSTVYAAGVQANRELINQCRQNIRSFYTVFYWFQKLAELVAVGVVMALVVSFSNNYQNENPADQWKRALSTWAVLLTVIYTIAAVLMLVVSCGIKIVETKPDKSYIVNTVKVIAASWRLRSQNPTSGPFSFLNAAKSLNNGPYSNGLVDDRKAMARLFVASVFLLPIAFVSNSCNLAVYPDMMMTYLNNTDRSKGKDVAIKMGYASIASPATSVLSMIILHFIFYAFSKYTQYKPKLLWKIVSGYIAMMISCASSILVQHYADSDAVNKHTEVSWTSFAAPYGYLGLSNALVYTAGYEMTLVLSPRSSQCLAMGVFLMLDGLGMLIGSVPYTTPYYTTPLSQYWYWLIGYIIFLFVGAIGYVVADRKLKLGLSEN